MYCKQDALKTLNCYLKLLDDDIKYIEKLSWIKKFKYCRVFMINNFEINYSKIENIFSLNKQIKQKKINEIKFKSK